jgi:hypothetical protein
MQPIVDLNWDHHLAFYLATAALLFVGGFIIWLRVQDEIESGTMLTWCFFIGISIMALEDASYQPQKFYENRQVVGTFVGYQPEGYNEQSGKTRADHHYMYVVYEVDGVYAIFNACTGCTYPKRAVLYYNRTKE